MSSVLFPEVEALEAGHIPALWDVKMCHLLINKTKDMGKLCFIENV